MVMFCIKHKQLFQFRCSVVSNSLQRHELQHTRLPCPSPTPRAWSNLRSSSVMPSNHLTLCRSLLLPSSVFPSIRIFSNESVLCIRWPNYWSFSLNISPSNKYPGLISFRKYGLISLQSKGLSESSQTPQFKSINSSMLSFLYSLTLTSIHDYWKNHRLD